MQKNIKEIVSTDKLKEQVEKYLTTKNTDITWYNDTVMRNISNHENKNWIIEMKYFWINMI